jgi:hypothetical protein
MGGHVHISFGIGVHGQKHIGQRFSRRSHDDIHDHIELQALDSVLITLWQVARIRQCIG